MVSETGWGYLTLLLNIIPHLLCGSRVLLCISNFTFMLPCKVSVVWVAMISSVTHGIYEITTVI